MADIGYVLHFSLGDMLVLTCSELIQFHQQATRLGETEHDG